MIYKSQDNLFPRNVYGTSYSLIMHRNLYHLLAQTANMIETSRRLQRASVTNLALITRFLNFHPLASIDYRCAPMASQLVARPCTLHLAELQGCRCQNPHLFRAAQASRKDRRIASGARQSQPGRSRGVDFSTRIGSDLCFLRVPVFGCDSSHDTASSSTEPHYNPTHRADDCGCVQKWHHPVHPKHHQTAQIS